MKRALIFLTAPLLLQSLTAQERWVATWAASPQAPRVIPARPPQAAAAPNSAAQPAAPPPPLTAFNNQTVRMIAHVSLGGKRVRVHLSNAHGTAPLEIGSAHVAVRATDSEIMPGSDRKLTFGGRPSFKIPAGATVVSDLVELDVAPLSDLAVSVYVPGETGPATTHALG